MLFLLLFFLSFFYLAVFSFFVIQFYQQHFCSQTKCRSLRESTMSRSNSEEKGSSTSCVDQEKDFCDRRAESKTASESPPQPPCEAKKHWSTTEEGALVARATAHVYRAIIASQRQGGMKDFLEEKCSLFKDLAGVCVNDQRLLKYYTTGNDITSLTSFLSTNYLFTNFVFDVCTIFCYL